MTGFQKFYCVLEKLSSDVLAEQSVSIWVKVCLLTWRQYVKKVVNKSEVTH